MQPGLDDVEYLSQTFYNQTDIAYLCTGINHPDMTEQQRNLLLRVVVGAKRLHETLGQLLDQRL